jgi:hypothetical protein
MFTNTNCPSWNDPNFYTNLAPGPFCHQCSSLKIKDGQEQKGLFAKRDHILLFELNDTVKAGQSVTCALEVPNGDANLYVKFGNFPNFTFQDCDCGSATVGAFDEDCTTVPAKSNTTAFIAVKATEESSNMTLFCFINNMQCLQIDQPCIQTEDCCGTMVCDGNATEANRCVPCKKPEPCDTARCASKYKSCSRTGQCCRWYKCDGVCKK